MGDPFRSPLCVVFCIMRWHSCQSVLGLSILQDVVLGAEVVEVMLIHLQGKTLLRHSGNVVKPFQSTLRDFLCYGSLLY